MKNKYLKFLFPIALILALTLSMIGTRNVLADDVPPTSTEEVPTETPPVESSPTEETPTETPPVEPSSTEEPADIPENTDETVPEIMEQLPAETELIVLDENGELLPLVSNEAADILVAGDPQWCMAGYTPADDPLGGTYCTAKFFKFNGAGGLIEELTNGLGVDAGPGTIYVSHDYDTAAAGDDIDHITFNYNDVLLTDLVVQGGWDFAQNKVVGTSTISLGMGFSLEFLDWGYGVPGSLTLKDLIVTNGNGLFIGDGSDYTTADVALENVDVTDTEYGAYIETEGNVEITDSSFNNSNDDGLVVHSYSGDITLTRVWSEDNFGDGAYLETCGCGSGNIFVNSSSFIENGDRGLVAYAYGNITVDSIDAEWNEVGGVELDNCAGFFFFGGCTNTNPSTVTMTGTNTIRNNGYDPIPFMGGPDASVGLWVTSAGDISIEGTNVTDNGAGDIGGGAFIYTEGGTLAITNSTFNDNCLTASCYFGFGLIALNASSLDTTLNGVTANNNGNNSYLGFGAAVLAMNGNAFVKNSTFNNNCSSGACSGGGLLTMAAGDVYFNFVDASSNGNAAGYGDGAGILAEGNVDIYCSTFNNNFGNGLTVDVPTGSALTLNGVTHSGNMTDFIPPASGGTWVSNPFDCNPVSSKGNGKPATNPVLPLNVVNVGNGNGTDLDCENFSGTKLVLINGDNLVVPCPLGGSASLTEQGSEGLPSALPNGSTFRSGFVSVVNESGSVNGKLSKSVLVSFVIPDGVDASSLAILFWDGSQWTEVDGTFILTENGKAYFAAYVNYTGTFVLVQR